MANIQVCLSPRLQVRCRLFSATAIISAFTLLGAVPGAAQSNDAEPNRNWEAEVALGASLSTGNTERKSLDVDAKASHRAGRFEDHYKLSGEFARESGTTTASRVKGGVQSNSRRVIATAQLEVAVAKTKSSFEALLCSTTKYQTRQRLPTKPR